MISIECYKGMPFEYESFLTNKYHSFLTSCRYIEIYFPDYEINYMIVYENSIMSDLLIFGNSGKIAKCFNSLVHIDQEIMYECAQNLFKEYPHVQKLVITQSYRYYRLKKSVLFDKSNDYILKFPPSLDEYLMELGYSTRKNIRNLRSKLLRDYPDVRITTHFGNEIREDIIQRIIQLNIDRMLLKGIRPGKDITDTKNIYKYSQYYGCVSYIEINDQVVAGNISYVVNDRIFGFVIAHDNEFSRYNLGRMCQLHVFEKCIEKGLSTFHFLWGDNEYKKTLLAKPHSLFSYYIYQSYSIDYHLNRLRSFINHVLHIIRKSNLAKPIRDSIKSYRSNKWKK